MVKPAGRRARPWEGTAPYTLFVAEPAPLMQGGGAYEQVDLRALVASEFPIDTGAEVGGFEVVGSGQYWLITHTVRSRTSR